VPHGELTAKKWLDSIEKQKRRINLKFVTDRQTDRQSQWQKNNTPSLGAVINIWLHTGTVHWHSLFESSTQHLSHGHAYHYVVSQGNFSAIWIVQLTVNQAADSKTEEHTCSMSRVIDTKVMNFSIMYTRWWHFLQSVIIHDNKH